MRIKSVVALMCIGLILIMCGCRETREKLSVEEVNALSYLIAFAISVLAGVVSYYICKWLDGDS